MKNKFYIKDNSEVNECTKEEYKEYLNKIKSEGKTYLCRDCSVCTCEKVRYTDIYRCEGVNEAAYHINKKRFKDENGRIRSSNDIDFLVYDCDYFKRFKELSISDDKKIRTKILSIDKEILENKKNNVLDDITNNLLKKRLLLLDEINDESVRDDLLKEEQRLFSKLKDFREDKQIVLKID